MKILHEDLRHQALKVAVNNLDDLWTLYNVIEKSDLVISRTTREVKTEGVGRPSSRRVPTTLGIKVEKVYFDKDLVRLRIHGIVVDAPDNLSVLGSHHTISLSEGAVVKIIKQCWAQHEIASIRKAVTAEPPVIIAAIDNDEYAVGVSRPLGVELKVELKSKIPGKRESEKRDQAITKYLSEASEALAKVKESVQGRIVIVGPAFTKEHLAGYLKNNYPDLARDLVAVRSVSTGGAAGVYEAIRVGLISKVLRDARTLQELELVEELLARLGASTGDVSYGIDQVSEDAASGAVETVLICDETLRGSEEEQRRRLEETLRLAEAKGGKVIIVSAGHEGGRKLKSLGGLAALLRYARHRGT
ncbi:MAG: mRNA surveillance protein pelota [Candidatus Bathyarchaeia archaeon]